MNIKIIFAFVMGVGAAGAAGWFIAKKRYEKIAQEEIDSVKAKYTIKKPEGDISEKVGKAESTGIDGESDISVNAEKPSEQADTGKTDISEKPKNGGKNDRPFLISPDEYGSVTGYELTSLTYYEGDGILANDENDEEIEDIDGTVGADFVNYFGEYEEDAAYVRNDILETDFEILRDRRSYSDVVKNLGYYAGD